MLALRETLQTIREGNDSLNIKSRPSSATPTLRHRRTPLFVASPAQKSGTAVLPRPLSAGLRYAAEVSTFEELADRKILEVSDDEAAHLTESQVNAIYAAKCLDQECPKSFDRMNRFLTLVGEQCKGQFFVMRQCGLGPNATRAICTSLISDENYTHLDLSGNDLGAEGGKAIAELLRKNQTLCVLRLQSANLGESGVYSIVDALHKNLNLTALDFSGISGIHRNNIWGRAAKALGYMLQTNQVLSYLNLSCTGVQRTAPFIVACSLNHAALTHLDLSGNSITDETCVALAKLLTEGICSLEVLVLDHNCIKDEGIVKLSSALNSSGQSANSLHRLELGHNAFGVRGCQALGEALATHPSLHTLNLEHNTLCRSGLDEDGYRLPDSIDGVAHFFKSLESNSKLQVLKMEGCDLRTLPEASLSLLLHRTTSLRTLDLSNNKFGDAPLPAIARGLSANKTLHFLGLAGCGISDEGGSVLAAAIEVHPSLKSLRLHNVALNYKTSGLLAALQSNHSLTSIDGGKNTIEVLAPVIHRNKMLEVKAAGPELVRVQNSLQEEKDDLVRTQDLIADEIRRRERTLENIKIQRERQKASTTQHKIDMEELQEQADRMAHVHRILEKKCNDANEGFTSQRNKLDAEQFRIKLKIDTQINHKLEAKKAITELKAQLAAQGVDPEVDALEKQLKTALMEVEHEKSMYNLVLKRIQGEAAADALAQSPSLTKAKSMRRKESMKKKK
jgi:Ran GTPase-activating protein (RanGAP) involved in mRNA processing and transport